MPCRRVGQTPPSSWPTQKTMSWPIAFRKDRWRGIYSTNFLERLNKEIKRRTNVAGIFPDVPSIRRLVGFILMEIDDEWQVGRR